MLVKITAAAITINNKRIKITVVRNSAWCRWLTNKDFLILGNSIHYRAARLNARMIHEGLNEVKQLHKVGYVKYYWSLLTTD
jgi:hypothetical protein